MQKIIANTLSAQEEFMDQAKSALGGGNAFSTLVLSPEELSAIQQGACVVFDNGEFSFFVALSECTSG